MVVAGLLEVVDTTESTAHRIEFFVRGEPKGQPRPRAFAFAGKARVYDPGTAEGWKSCIAEAVRPHLPESPVLGPIDMRITFYMPRPKSHFRTGENAGLLKGNAPTKFTGKPDVDNLAKAVMDALVIVGLMKDDSQVASLNVSKVYCNGDLPVGAVIAIDF